MKGIFIDVHGNMILREYSEPVYQSVGKDVGGWIEIVRPVFLPKEFVMIVDDSGALKEDAILNPIASALYGFLENRDCQIYGNVVLMKEGYTEEGSDLVDMTLFEVYKLWKGTKYLNVFDLIDGRDEKHEHKFVEPC